jgi:hypothetical protein
MIALPDGFPTYLARAKARTRDTRMSWSEFDQELSGSGLHQLFHDNRVWLPSGGRMLTLCEPGSGKGQPAQRYVDPSLDSDTGSGTIGDPYGDLQHALNSTTTANDGFQFNIKSGTPEVLVAALTLATYGNPSNTAPLILRGYDAVADDGGQGEIDLAGFNLHGIAADTNIFQIDLKIGGGVNTSNVIDTGARGGNIRVEASGPSNNGIQCISECIAIDCHIYNCDNIGVNVTGGSAFFNFVDGRTIHANRPAIGVSLAASGAITRRNIVVYEGSGTSTAFRLANDACGMVHNSALGIGTSGTANGFLANVSTVENICLLNNIAEGFVVGFDLFNNAENVAAWGHNAAFNNTTNYNRIPGDITNDIGDNEVLPSSAFAKQGAISYANRFNYFAPLDVGNLRGKAFPLGHGFDKGAVQVAPAGFGSSLVLHQPIRV